MLQYRTIPVTPFIQNCSLVWCDQTLQAAVIDPGADLDRLQAEANRRMCCLQVPSVGRTFRRVTAPRWWLMEDDTGFIPRHGPESTFGQERRTNPYVAD